MHFLHKELESIIKDFEKAHRKERLSVGMFDKNILKFIRKLLEELISNYDKDAIYFEITDVLNNFFNEMSFSLSGTNWMAWTDVDFAKLQEISLGEKETLDKLKEIQHYYQVDGMKRE